jgi:hypothetical protein
LAALYVCGSPLVIAPYEAVELAPGDEHSTPDLSDLNFLAGLKSVEGAD